MRRPTLKLTCAQPLQHGALLREPALQLLLIFATFSGVRCSALLDGSYEDHDHTDEIPRDSSFLYGPVRHSF